MENGYKNENSSLDEIIHSAAKINADTFNSIKDKFNPKENINPKSIVPVYSAGYKNYLLNPSVLDNLKKSNKINTGLINDIINAYQGLIKSNNIETNPDTVRLTHEDYTALSSTWDIMNLISLPKTQEQKGILGRMFKKEEDSTRTRILPIGELPTIEVISGIKLQRYTNNPKQFLEYLVAVDCKIKELIDDLPDDSIERAKKYIEILKNNKSKRVKDNRYGNVKREISPELALKKLKEYSEDIVHFANNKDNRINKATIEDLKIYYLLASTLHNADLPDLSIDNVELEMNVIKKAHENKSLENLRLKELEKDITYKMASQILSNLTKYASAKLPFEFEDVTKVLGSLNQEDIKKNIESTLKEKGFEDMDFAMANILKRIEDKINKKDTNQQAYSTIGKSFAELIKEIKFN